MLLREIDIGNCSIVHSELAHNVCTESVISGGTSASKDPWPYHLCSLVWPLSCFLYMYLVVSLREMKWVKVPLSEKINGKQQV